MQLSRYAVSIEFTEPVLGTVPKNKEIYKDYVESKKPVGFELSADAQAALVLAKERLKAESRNSGIAVADAPDDAPESDGITDIEERGWTGFMQDEAGPYVFDYYIKGHLKDVGNVLKDDPSIDIKNFRSKIENYVFVQPRRLHFEAAPGYVAYKTDVLERPLRAQTMQGPRVSLVRSDTIANSQLRFTLVFVGNNKEVTPAKIKELFNYGVLRGMGQWRNGGWGRYVLTKFEKLD